MCLRFHVVRLRVMLLDIKSSRGERSGMTVFDVYRAQIFTYMPLGMEMKRLAWASHKLITRVMTNKW